MLDGLTLFFPCHNEEENVEVVIREALRIAPAVARSFEILIIDDGSTDHTPDIVARIVKEGQPVRLIQHDRCRGYGAAVAAGFKAAQYPWIFFSDGDRQFKLDELPWLVEKISSADIISGFRAHRADPWHRTLNSKIYGAALRVLFGIRVPDINCAFKLIRREIFDRIQLKGTGAIINAELIVKAQRLGYRMVSLPVSHRPRAAGTPTGANGRVILKAMRELVWLLKEGRKHGSK